MSAALKYTFFTAPNCMGRKVTVVADSEEQARDKARVELDRRCARVNIEPPVGWTLYLAKKHLNWWKPAGKKA